MKGSRDPQTLTTLSAKQAASFTRATRRINLWHGSIRSGKTFVSILRWMHWVATEAPGTGALVMIGNTRDTLGRNVLDVIAELDPDALQWNRGAPTAKLYGRLVHIIGASDVRAENRIRGLTVAGAYVDEVTLLQEAMWTQLLGRMSVDGAMLFGTTNPDSPSHWLRKKYLLRADKIDIQVLALRARRQSQPVPRVRCRDQRRVHWPVVRAVHQGPVGRRGGSGPPESQRIRQRRDPTRHGTGVVHRYRGRHQQPHQRRRPHHRPTTGTRARRQRVAARRPR